MAEYFDVYTGAREKTGIVLPRGSELAEGQFHLIVFVCVFNREGKMLIQQRSDAKKHWPGIWDVSVGGSVLAGETSEEAAIRETKEELGLTVAFDRHMPVMSVVYEDSIHDMYTAHSDAAIEDLKLQTEEVQAAKWASLEKIREMIRDGSFIGVYESFIEMLFHMQDKRGILK